MNTKVFILASSIAFLIPFSGISQTTLWLENFENGCASGCATFTGVNGAWTFITSPAAPAGLCGYASPNGASSNVWYVSCAENGTPNGGCGAGCGANESMHMGSVTLGDIGAAYDAARTTCKMTVSPSINTSAAGTNTKTLTFEHIRFGQGTTDCAQLLYSIDNGANWIFLANPIPVVTCCSGACGGQDQGVWATLNFTLPATCDNISTLKIGLNWKNNATGGSDPSFAINDLRITYTAVLPVELVSFSGHQKNTAVELEWSTASEVNNAFFEIERSTDREIFTTIGKIQSKGNSNSLTSYSHTDLSPQAGTMYYRLKQVDLNGTVSYSDILPVEYNDNPVNPIELSSSFDTENLIVHIKSDEARTVKLEIYDATGKQVLNKNYILAEGKNKVTLPAGSMPATSYIIRVGDVKNASFSSSLVATKATR
ncbi:MAG: hypothetical protein ACHQF2_12240 [Flavobacteriales bacterium]